MIKLTRPQMTRFIFTLMLIAFLGLVYMAYKDFSLTPTERFEYAQQAEKDGKFSTAERYYISAAADTDKNVSKIAAYYLGRLYKTGGKNFPVNGKRAEMYFEQAALENLPQAQYELALMYDVGDKIPENRERAVYWMNLSAKQGYTDALYSLGVWIERGYLGQPDMDKVIALYEKAAQNNHIYAITSLIALYSGGFSAFPRDVEKANYWMNKLVELNQKNNNTQNETKRG